MHKDIEIRNFKDRKDYQQIQSTQDKNIVIHIHEDADLDEYQKNLIDEH